MFLNALFPIDAYFSFIYTPVLFYKFILKNIPQQFY